MGETVFKVTKPTAPVGTIILKSLWYGFIAGMISGMVKIGWEVIFPPRTIERNATNPPQTLLEQFGMTSEQTHSFVMFGDQKVFYVALIIHFAFSIVCAMVYLFAAQYLPITSLWQGAAFGLVVWVFFHLILMPAMGTVPAAWNQPWEEHFSELFGHAVWGWAIAACGFFLAQKDRSKTLVNL